MTFDPYHKWLGIPPEEQPPNYYRLLAIRLFETDPDVIDDSGDRQAAHVHKHQGGKHAEHAQRLLNEIATARVVLLNTESKAHYDAELKSRFEKSLPNARAVPRQEVPIESPRTSIGETPLDPPRTRDEAPDSVDADVSQKTRPIPMGSPQRETANRPVPRRRQVEVLGERADLVASDRHSDAEILEERIEIAEVRKASAPKQRQANFGIYLLIGVGAIGLAVGVTILGLVAASFEQAENRQAHEPHSSNDHQDLLNVAPDRIDIVEEEDSGPPPPTGMIGKWQDSILGTVTFIRRDDKFFETWRFRDGSSMSGDLVQRKVGEEWRFERVGSSEGSYYVIDTHGDLRMNDNGGYISTAQSIASAEEMALANAEREHLNQERLALKRRREEQERDAQLAEEQRRRNAAAEAERERKAAFEIAARNWRSNFKSQSFSIKAVLVGYRKGGTITLRKEDGSEVEVKLSTLMEEDRLWAVQQCRERGWYSLSLADKCVLAYSCDKGTFAKQSGRIFVLDLSGSQNHGELAGATAVNDGTVSCLAFDGKDDSVLSLKEAPAISGSFTVSLLVKYTGQGAGGKAYWTLLNRNISGAGSNDPYHMYVLANAKTLSARVGNSQAEEYLNSGVTVASSKWHHVVLLFDSTESEYCLYVDGRKAVEKKVADSWKSVAGSGRLSLGAWPRYGSYFRGELSDIAVWERRLTDDEILQLHAIFWDGKSYCKAIGETLAP